MDLIYCPACKAENQASEYCKRCNFPFQGSEDEKSLHVGRFISERKVMEASEKAIKKSQRILLIVAGLSFIGFLVAIFSPEYLLTDALFSLLLTVIFAIFGIFIRRSPMVFTIIPMLFLILLYTVNTIFSPELFFRGFVFKLLVLGSLGYAVYMIYQAEQFRKNITYKMY